MKCICSCRTMCLAFLISVCVGFPSVPLCGAVTPYPLKKVALKGFQISQGILAWAPVSSSKAVAFARDKAADGSGWSLRSFSLTTAGGTTSSQRIAAEMGIPVAATCFWIDSASTSHAPARAPYGLLFVLFEEYGTNTDTATLSVAIFNASGARTSDWKELLTITTSEDWYISGEDLFASNRGESIGIVPSLAFGHRIANGGFDSRVYFLEASVADGSLIGNSTSLSLPSNGMDVYGTGFLPLWNGTSWIVPVTASLYEPATGWAKVLENRALVYTVSGDIAHRTAMKKVAKDAIDSPATYSEMFLTPYPGSATDSLMFVRHRRPISKSQQQLDMFAYDHSIKRLDSKGRTLKSVAVTIPAPAHKMTYDPASELAWEYDYWSALVSSGESVLLSQSHTIEVSTSQGFQYEQAAGFYAINALTGAVELRAQTINLWKDVLLFRPLIHSFSASSVAVVNRAYHTPSPYPWDNYFSVFSVP